MANAGQVRLHRGAVRCAAGDLLCVHGRFVRRDHEMITRSPVVRSTTINTL